MPLVACESIHEGHNTMQCNAMQCNAMQCNAMQCNAMQCNTIKLYFNTVKSSVH
jgi:hypothetical protein